MLALKAQVKHPVVAERQNEHTYKKKIDCAEARGEQDTVFDCTVFRFSRCYQLVNESAAD